MDLMNADFSDEDSSSDDDNGDGVSGGKKMSSKELFDRYGETFPVHEAVEAGDRDAIGIALKKAVSVRTRRFFFFDDCIMDASIDASSVSFSMAFFFASASKS